jgi:hypothetical protein
MRWKAKDPPEGNEWKRKFLFLPREINGLVCWLEFAEYRLLAGYKNIKLWRNAVDKNIEVSKKLREFAEAQKKKQDGFLTHDGSGSLLFTTGKDNDPVLISNDSGKLTWKDSDSVEIAFCDILKILDEHIGGR